MPKHIARPWLTFVTDETEAGGSSDGEQRDEQPQGRTFTQDDLDAHVRDRVARVHRKYGDYAQLKADSEELQRLRDQEKTDSERQADAVAKANREKEAAEERAKRAEWDMQRYRTAARYGISGDYLDLLTGDSEEALEANAKRLGDLLDAKVRVERDGERRVFGAQGVPGAAGKPGAAPVEDTGQPTAEDEARAAAMRRGRITVTTQQ